MRRLTTNLFVSALAVALSGCAMTFDATKLGVPVTMGSAGSQAPQGERFSVKTSAVYAFWGVVPLKQPNLQKPLEQQLLGGKSVSDLRIKVSSKWYQVVFTVLTVGLLVPRTVTYEGVITP
jgi:hypothetical protein